MSTSRSQRQSDTAALRRLEERLDAMYAELGEIKRHMILSVRACEQSNETAWDDLMEASTDVTDRWDGVDAVDEIRAQRTK